MFFIFSISVLKNSNNWCFTCTSHNRPIAYERCFVCTLYMFFLLSSIRLKHICNFNSLYEYESFCITHHTIKEVSYDKLHDIFKRIKLRRRRVRINLDRLFYMFLLKRNENGSIFI